MPGIIESLSTLNSIVRTALALVAVGILGAAGYYGYRIFNANDLARPARFFMPPLNSDGRWFS